MDVSSSLWMHSLVSNRLLRVKNHQETNSEAHSWAAKMAFISHHLHWLDLLSPFTCTTASKLLSDLSACALDFISFFQTTANITFSKCESVTFCDQIASLFYSKSSSGSHPTQKSFLSLQDLTQSGLPGISLASSLLLSLSITPCCFWNNRHFSTSEIPHFISPKHFHGFISHFFQVFVREEYMLVKITIKYQYSSNRMYKVTKIDDMSVGKDMKQLEFSHITGTRHYYW